jgi:hypothetical protein
MTQSEFGGSRLEFQSLLDSVPNSDPFTSNLDFFTSAKPSRRGFLSRYRHYFDIDSKAFFLRLLQAINPLNRNFIVDLDRPDLFGPLLISVAAPFVMMVLGNFSFWPYSTSRWHFRLSAFLFSVFFTQFCVFAVPAGYVWFASHYVSPATEVHVMCLVGYASAAIIPTSALCLVVGRVADWAVAMVGGFWAAFSVFWKLQYPFNVFQNAGRAFGPNVTLAFMVWWNTFVCFMCLFR